MSKCNKITATWKEKLGMKNKGLKNSLIPLGMVFGAAIGVIFGMFFTPISQGFSISIGAGVGLLVGTVAYRIYSEKG